jgi:hypothetical protein
MVDFKTRQYYYNQCKPIEPLDPTDTRNVNFDAEGTEGARLRGASWVERLASQVELSNEPTCLLFTGLPGSGKSTELRRLSKRLADPHRAHLLPVIIEAEEVVDLASAVDIPDLIAAIIYAADKTVLDAEGRESSQALRDGYLTIMAIRLLELHRVLKPTGSIYLHCDPVAGHYLKVLMDAIFGPDNFRNEIIWKRTSAHSDAK